MAAAPARPSYPRFEDDDPALLVYVRAGQGCDDFVIDIIQDPQGLLTLGGIDSDWNLPIVRALFESMLLERMPLP